MTELMSFGKALDKLKGGTVDAITRSDWYDTEARPVVKLQLADENSKMTESYLYMEKYAHDGKYVRFPVDLSAESVLSDNWIAAELKQQQLL